MYVRPLGKFCPTLSEQGRKEEGSEPGGHVERAAGRADRKVLERACGACVRGTARAWGSE